MSEDQQTEAPKIDPAELDTLRKSNEAMQKKLEELLGETKAEREKRRLAEEAAQKAAEDAARKSGDVEALEKSWQDKLAAREAELRRDLESRDAWVRDLTVGQAASALASDLAVQGSAAVLLPHIKARLATDYRDGKPVTVVLDADGKPSAMSLEELKQEFATNAAFAPLIVGSKASGPGGVGAKGSASNLPGKKVADWSMDEKSLYIREHGLDAWKTLVAKSA
jgi:hypothetical protein